MFGRKYFISAIAGLLLAGYFVNYACSAEFEAIDRLTADGYTLLKTTADVQGNSFTVGGSTFVVQYGKVGISSSAPAALLSIQSAAGNSGNLVLISTGTSNVIRMTGAGEIFATKFIGDGSLVTNVTAVDSSKLGGLPAASYLTLEYSYRGCVGQNADCVPPACVGTSVIVNCSASLPVSQVRYCERVCTRP